MLKIMLYYVVKVYIPDYWSSFIHTREGNLRTQQKIIKKKKKKNIKHKKTTTKQASYK